MWTTPPAETRRRPDPRERITALADCLIAVLIAPGCAACGASLEHPTRGPVCPRCWAGIVPVTAPICRTCGDPVPSWRVVSTETEVCARCRRGGSAIERARGIGGYDGRLRAIIHALKYGRRQAVAAPLARRMRAADPDVMDGVDVAIPVPLHRHRRRTRGFNQAAALARHLGVPCSEVLRRTRQTASQTDLPAARRHANVRGAFAMRRGRDVRGLCVLLVDDVCTTGATLEACASVLKEAGAREVRALTAARVAMRER